MTPLIIAATGACTPIGYRAWQNATGVDTKVSALTKQSISGQKDYLATVSRIKAIEESCTGVDRLIRIAAPALHECLTTAPEIWPLRRPIPLFIAVPKPLRSDIAIFDVNRFGVELPRALDIAPEYLPIRIFAGDSAAGGDAFLAAYRFMDEHPEADEVLVGGVECLTDPQAIQTLFGDKLIKVNHYSDGFIAAEGAAFVRLRRVPFTQHYVKVYPPAIASEPRSRAGSEDFLEGSALIEAATQALRNANFPADALYAYWSDMDGQPWRGSELANLNVALGKAGKMPPAKEPAAVLGELSAAWVPLLMSLYHEMRQGLHHPFSPQQLSGHAALQSVSGLGTRIAAWVIAWDYASRLPA